MSEQAPTRQGRHTLRLATPLAAHLVPTAAIGYGVVLPAAGIPPGGAVGVGFAASLAGTFIAYIAGIRLARTCGGARRPGVLGRVLSAQAAHPRGLLGRALGRLWVVETAAVNDRAIALLAAARGEHIVEIGFGPGRAIHELAARGARITGIDASPTMLAAAQRRNADNVRAGPTRLHLGTADALPLPAATADAVLAVHALYFWPDLDAALDEIHRVLVDRGRLVLAFRAAEHGLPRRFDPAIYHVPTTARIRGALVAAGFDEVTAEHDARGVTYLTARAAVRGTPHVMQATVRR